MKKLFILITCLITMGSFAWGQNPECPTGCIELSTGNITQTLRDPDCAINVNYTVYDCGGVRTVKINSLVAEGSCEAMLDFSIYHYNVNSLEEMISLTILEREAYITPACPNGAQIMKVYTANCGIWVGCTYDVSLASRSCDPGYNPPYPNFNEGGIDKVKVWKWQPCGTICCENIYEICTDHSVVTGDVIFKMTKVSAGPQGGDTCTEQYKYATACQTGCM